jgi:hypothetical protein
MHRAPLLFVRLAGDADTAAAAVRRSLDTGAVDLREWGPEQDLPAGVEFAAAFVLCGPRWAEQLRERPEWADAIALALRRIIRVVPVLAGGVAAVDLAVAPPGRTGLLESRQAIYWDGAPATRAQLADLVAYVADGWHRQERLRAVDSGLGGDGEIDPAVRAIIEADVRASFGDFT